MSIITEIGKTICVGWKSNTPPPPFPPPSPSHKTTHPTTTMPPPTNPPNPHLPLHDPHRQPSLPTIPHNISIWGCTNHILDHKLVSNIIAMYSRTVHGHNLSCFGPSAIPSKREIISSLWPCPPTFFCMGRALCGYVFYACEYGTAPTLTKYKNYCSLNTEPNCVCRWEYAIYPQKENRLSCFQGIISGFYLIANWFVGFNSPHLDSEGNQLPNKHVIGQVTSQSHEPDVDTIFASKCSDHDIGRPSVGVPFATRA